MATKPTLKIDWLRLERRIKELLSGLDKADFAEPRTRAELRAALWDISEIMGEETGRGYPMTAAFKERTEASEDDAVRLLRLMIVEAQEWGAVSNGSPFMDRARKLVK